MYSIQTGTESIINAQNMPKMETITNKREVYDKNFGASWQYTNE